MPHVHTPQSHCRVGVARGDITPPVGIYHRMWGAATHDRSTGVHRPLTATALALRPMAPSDDGSGVLLVSLDHCMLGQEDLDNIRGRVSEATSFARQDIHVSLSHTHGAGLMMRDRTGLPGGELIVPYLEDVASRVAQLAREAEQRLRPAWVVYGTGRCDLAAHRDFFDEQRGGFVCGFNPGHPADDTLLVARVTGEDGRTVATVVNYACHPTTLAWENTLISPDYPGATREVVEAATGGAPCVFLQGASGELGPREGYVGDASVADRNGRRLGYAALSALESLPPAGTQFEYQGAIVSGAVLGTWAHVPLERDGVARASVWRHRSWTIALPYRRDLPKLEDTRTEQERLGAEEASARGRGDISAAHDLRARVEQATRQIMRLEALPPGDVFPLSVTAWRLGDAVWVCPAGEHYSKLQTSLGQRFPGVPIVVSTITDGWQPGYLPTAETYGRGIYQESISMVAPGSLDRVIGEVGDQIDQWRGAAGG
jgi:hypothetical protein